MTLFQMRRIGILKSNILNIKKTDPSLLGEWTEDDVFRKFLESFDTPGQADGEVTSAKRSSPEF